MPPIELDSGLPFWIGGVVLGLLSATFALVVRRPLGGSGAVACAFSLQARADEQAIADEAALREATLAMFGDDAVARASVSSAPAEEAAPPLSWTPSVVFVACLIVGGLLSRLLPGGPEASGPWVSWLGGAAGSGLAALAALFFGGLLVGFGTQMAGGCTTGHGLTGAPRLQPGSLVTTAAFFGTGVVVAFGLQALFGGAP